MAKPRHKRLFFALWPDEATREHLSALQARLLPVAGGRWVHRDDLHLTLHFLGRVESGFLPTLEQAVEQVAVPTFSLLVDHCDYWPKPRIAWAGFCKPPNALLDLHQQLKMALERIGCKLEKRPYRPHITLARDLPPCEFLRLSQPIEWQVEDFVLVESCLSATVPRYRVLQTWELEPMNFRY